MRLSSLSSEKLPILGATESAVLGQGALAVLVSSQTSGLAGISSKNRSCGTKEGLISDTTLRPLVMIWTIQLCWTNLEIVLGIES